MLEVLERNGGPNVLNIKKYHKSGNDVLIVLGDANPGRPVSQLLLDRHFGLGADQCIYVQSLSPTSASAEVSIFNQDGSRAFQCLNGMLCLGMELFSSYPKIPSWRIASGPFENELLKGPPEGVRFSKVSLQLEGYDCVYSSPQLWSDQGVDYVWAGCDVGNPHVIIFTTQDPYDMGRGEFKELCEGFLKDFVFPQGVNVSLAYRYDRRGVEAVRLRTHERGSGETHACGSAALACMAVCYHFFQTHSSMRIDSRFDYYDVSFDGCEGLVCGQAHFVYETTMEPGSLERALETYEWQIKHL